MRQFEQLSESGQDQALFEARAILEADCERLPTKGDILQLALDSWYPEPADVLLFLSEPVLPDEIDVELRRLLQPEQTVPTVVLHLGLL